MSLQYYSEEALSVLFQYSFEVAKDPSSPDSTDTVTLIHSVVAQLPVEGVASLSCDTSTPCDVGPLLTQVHSLGPFKAGGMAVSGNRKTAAVVSLFYMVHKL